MPSLQIQRGTILSNLKVTQEICGVAKPQIQQNSTSLLHTDISSMISPLRLQSVSVSQVSCQECQLMIIENNKIAPIATNWSFATNFNRSRLIEFRNLKLPQCFPYIANRAVDLLTARGNMYIHMYVIIEICKFRICMLL